MPTLAAWSGSRSHVGSIPSELGLMAGINYLHLNNNSLSGTIPPALGDCKYPVWVDLSNNELEGTIPRELAKQARKMMKGTPACI